MRLLRLLAGMLIMFMFASTSFAKDYYVVNVNGAAKYSESSFAHAKSSGTANFPNSFNGVNNVYVAKGTYTLTATLTINQNENVKIYGGFTSEETSINLETRDIANNETILKGNNTFSIIHCKANATIDGFTIQGGKGSLENNSGYYYGGGVCILEADPEIKNCTFKNNTAELGGGICVASYNNKNTSAKITNCVFENNSASKIANGHENQVGGAGVIVISMGGYKSQATITNCTFKDNTSGYYGGGVSVYKETSYVQNSTAEATMTCCTFTGNSATQDSAVFTNDTVTMTNCTLVNNTTSGTITKNNCIDNPAAAPDSSQEKGAYGVAHTVFLIEKNSAALTDCVYSGTKINELTTDQLGRTFHNPPSTGAVELSENLAITTESLTAGTVNKSYSAEITATGTEPLAWTISGLPSGLSANTTTTGKTLTITGTPTKSGNSSVKVNVSSFKGKIKAEEKTLALTINKSSTDDDDNNDEDDDEDFNRSPSAITAPSIKTESLPSGSVGENYSALVSASGSTPLTWQISGLPSGLNYADSIRTNTLITGQAAQSGTFDVTVTVTNSAGSDSKTLTLNIESGSQTTRITTPNLPAGFQGQNYRANLEATGSGESKWTASGLPDGLTLEGSLITGTPTVYGEFEVTLRVNNDSGTDTKTFMLKIYSINERSNRNAPEITSRAPTDGYYKRFYSHTFTARGETPFKWSVSGDVPDGLEIDSELGKFSGVPAETGEFYFTVTVANNSGSRSQTEKLTILDVPASMLIFEKICSNPFIIRISELKGSGLNIAKIFKDNYESFRFYTSRESGVTFIEFIENLLNDYTATAQLSNMTSLITAEFSGFESNQDFSFNYPANEKANTSQLVNISDSDSDSDIPDTLIIGSITEAHAENIEVLIKTLSDDELAEITRLDFISADSVEFFARFRSENQA